MEQVPQSRQILQLAVPAFLTLVVEPLFLLADSAIIGHLGTDQLAGLGIASTVLLTAVGLFVFLAYGTTAAVSRLVGAGRVGRAASAGMDGLYLAMSVAGFSSNIVLNLVLVYGAGLGIAGSALGTVVTQLGMAAVLIIVLVRLARRHGARLSPHPLGVLSSARAGIPLLIRTVSLRLVLVLTVWVAASLGDVTLAAHQVAFTVWNLLTFALDALAIAAQALTGRSLGAGDPEGARSATRMMVRWGVLGGLVLGLLLLAVTPWLPALFTTDPSVRSALTAALVVVAAGQMISGYVFVLDGVLIGAGDARWLALAMGALLLAYLPIIVALRLSAPWLTAQGPVTSVVVLWLGFTGFMVLRAVTLWWRSRSDAWMILGA